MKIMDEKTPIALGVVVTIAGVIWWGGALHASVTANTERLERHAEWMRTENTKNDQVLRDIGELKASNARMEGMLEEIRRRVK